MKETKLEQILFLISQEKSAIEDYTRGKEVFADDPIISAKLNEIMEDEEEHLKELSELLFKI